MNWISCVYGRFLKWGYPQIILILMGFSRYKPSSYGGTPMTMESSICWVEIALEMTHGFSSVPNELQCDQNPYRQGLPVMSQFITASNNQYLYIYMRVHMHIHIHIHMHMHIHIHIIYIYICIYIYIYITDIYTCTCTYTYRYTFTYEYMHVYIHIYIYTIHIYIYLSHSSSPTS